MALLLTVALHLQAHFLLENPLQSLALPLEDTSVQHEFTFSCPDLSAPAVESGPGPRLLRANDMARNVRGQNLEAGEIGFLTPKCAQTVQAWLK